MAKNKTAETEGSISDFLDNVADQTKRDDSYELIRLMQEQTGQPPKMWGPSIVGFGSYHYKYESGHEGDAPVIGFSPRAAAISLYLAPVFDKKEEFLANFGKHKTGKGCIYIKKLKDIDINVLREMIAESVQYIQNKYPS